MFNVSITGETAINRTKSYDANNAENDDNCALQIEMGILNDLNIRNEMKDTQYLNRAMVLST